MTERPITRQRAPWRAGTFAVFSICADFEAALWSRHTRSDVEHRWIGFDEGLPMLRRLMLRIHKASSPVVARSGTRHSWERAKKAVRATWDLVIVGRRGSARLSSPKSVRAAVKTGSPGGSRFRNRARPVRFFAFRTASPDEAVEVTRPPAGEPSPTRRFKAILVALVLCRGLALMCIMPPFEGWDEYQHVAYIVHLSETGQRPVLGEAVVPRSLKSRLNSFPHGPYAIKMLKPTGALDYASFWARPSKTGRVSSEEAESAPLPLYQAQHGPFYYSVAAPLFELAGGVRNLRSSIGALRLVNLLLTAASVWIALGIFERLIRNRTLSVLCGLLIATQPLFLINGARVANDALGVFFATVAIAAALDRRTFQSRPATFALGLVTGLATLAKSVHLGLVPFVAVVAFANGSEEQSGQDGRARNQQALGALLLAIAGFLVPTLAEFRQNFAHHGSLTIMQESIENRRAGRSATDLVHAAQSIDWVRWMRNLWLRKNIAAGGWSWAGDSERMKDQHEALLATALAGWVLLLTRWGRARLKTIFANRRDPVLCAALCAAYSAALGYHSVHSQLSWGVPTTNPWYAAAALPSFMAMVAGGAFLWPVGRCRFILPLLVGLHFLLAESSVVLGGMTSFYTAQADWNTALVRLALLQPAVFGTATLHVAVAAASVAAALALHEVFGAIAAEWKGTVVEAGDRPSWRPYQESRRRPIARSATANG